MQIRVKIGAAVDGDLKAILYEPLAQGLERARSKAKTEGAGMSSDAKARTAADLKVETAARIGEDRKRVAESLALTKSKLNQERTLVAQQRAHDLAMERDAARQKVREDENVARERRKISRETDREIECDRKQAAAGVRTFASSASGTAKGLVSRGVGLAGDMARGAGLSFDVGASVKKRVELESAAIGLVNAGYQPGKEGPAGQMQNKRAVMADIQKTGEAYGIDQMDLAAGLGAFVGKTGELQTGRDMLDAMARTAKATGATFEDVAAAAGAISNKLGDVGAGKDFATAEDKARAINKVMMAIAGQGKEGAVEIKDLATQMEKLTSQASKFKSNADLVKMTGNGTGANIAMLGVLAQAARKTEKGSAAQATQSAMAFVRDLTGQVALKRIGADTIYSDKSRTTLRDPQEIVKDILSKTKGDQSKLAYLMSNQNSRAVVNSFLDPYMKAYSAKEGTAKEKDAAGRAAVDAAFKTLKDATLKEDTQQRALAEELDSTKTKAERFQQQLDRVVGDMADKVIPSLSRLAPVALNAANAMSGMAVWATNNPLTAGAGVVGLSMGKAAAERVAGGVADRAAGAVAGAGMLGSALVGTMVIASVAALTISKVLSDKSEANRNRVEGEGDTLNTMTALKHAQRRAQEEASGEGGVSKETAAELDRAKEAANEERSRLQERITKGRLAASGDGTGYVASGINSLLAFMTAETRIGGGDTMEQKAKADEDAKELQQLSADLKALQQIMSGSLKVEIQNLPGQVPLLPGSTTGPGGG